MNPNTNEDPQEYLDIDFYNSKLPVALHDYGTEYLKFINEKILILHIKDRAENRYGTAVIDVAQKRAITNYNELSAKVKDLFRPVVRKYPYGSPKIEAKEVSVSEDGIVVMEGGHAKIGVNKYKYWVSVFSQDSQPVHYSGHKWNPVALTHSPETGLCASADKFGEIHVWRTRDGKQTNLFKPINEHFHHIQWSDDESGVYFASKPFSSKSRLEYTFNQYGPINHSIEFGDWTWNPADSVRPQYTKEPSAIDRLTGNTYRLAVKNGLNDLLVIGSNGSRMSLFESMGDQLNPNLVGKWGQPTCFNFLESPRSDGRLPFIVGTNNGFLLQFAIESIRGVDRPRLVRTFLAHEAQVNSIAQSPSGDLLASASLDGSFRIWRLDPARTLADVGFFTDGTRIINLGQDNSSGLEVGDGLISFDGGPFYERIQKIQRGDYQPGTLVEVVVERGEFSATEYKKVEKTFQVQLVAAPDIAEPVLNYFSAEGGAWIAWTKNGFYDASSDGARHVGWHVNQGRAKAAEFSKVQQFKKQLYRPDLVRIVSENWQSVDQLLAKPAAPGLDGPATSDRPVASDAPTPVTQTKQLVSVLENAAAEKALDNAPNTYEKYEERRPPKVRIQSPYGTTETEQGEIEIEFVIETPLSLPITDLTVYNNGRNLRVAPEKVSTKRKNGIEFKEYTATVELMPGTNNLSLKAKHAQAYSDFAEVTVEYRSRQPIDKSLPKLFVLAVGISDYQNDALDLTFADQDAKDFAAAWERQLGERYSVVETNVVTNADATVDGIEDGFAWLADQEVTADDFVFVFLAGHAMFDANDVWVFGSTDLATNKLTRTGVTDDRMNRLLDKELRTAGTVILFLDTCHAGGVKGKTRGRSAKKYHSQGKDIWQDSQRHVLASCKQNEVSMENNVWENGAFTEGLLQAMNCEKCDVDENGFVSIEELKIKTREFVRKMTNNQQTPTASGQSLNNGVTELVKISAGDEN